MAEAQAVPGIEGVEISVALHHMVTPLPEGESYLGFIFARGETPAAVEAAPAGGARAAAVYDCAGDRAGTSRRGPRKRRARPRPQEHKGDGGAHLPL